MLTRLDPRSLVERPRETLVAMAAPSCIATGHPAADAYAAAEASLVTLAATERGLDPDEILDSAKAEVTAVEHRSSRSPGSWPRTAGSTRRRWTAGGRINLMWEEPARGNPPVCRRVEGPPGFRAGCKSALSLRRGKHGATHGA